MQHSGTRILLGSLAYFFSLLGENGSTECFGITQRILDPVVEGMTLFKKRAGTFLKLERARTQ